MEKTRPLTCSILLPSCQDAMTSLSTNGFLNYFGAQRFGMDDKEVNASDIGLAMLQGDMVRINHYFDYTVIKLMVTGRSVNFLILVRAFLREFTDNIVVTQM